MRGGVLQSAVVQGRYGQRAGLQLFFLRQWGDERWPLTQHRSLRLLRAPFMPRAPPLSHNTVASEGVFDVTLGSFPSDVSLARVTVRGGGGGGKVLWSRTTGGHEVSRVDHGNGSHSYQLRVPLSHAAVNEEHRAAGHRTRSLTVTFDLRVSPGGEVFAYPATLESSAPDPDEGDRLRLEARCSERSLLVRLHYGARGPDHLQWELYLGGRRLDMELARMGRFRLEDHEDSLSVEIPLHGPGMVFEEVTLGRVGVRAQLSVVGLGSREEEDRIVQRCTFTPGELLACLPDGRVVAVVDTTHSAPPVQPNRTTLLDPSCVPMETDSARALFVFDVGACGTTLTTEGDLLIYENQVRNHQEFLPLVGDPVIERDTPYRLTLQCRYPASDSRNLFSSLHV
ncbi:uncharacterized protein LOC132445692 [Gadus macrocephalus]|uniref:uncharacterized protein LOC132445692 n=1 Tax=Gadus macrocephalus TaxID=80720 RepID=UPI0028CB9082|nr:uncharacterized protein LOC132445692 [Gadus macrocephalus]